MPRPHPTPRNSVLTHVASTPHTSPADHVYVCVPAAQIGNMCEQLTVVNTIKVWKGEGRCPGRILRLKKMLAD
eukprot:94353-Chlamydomonas_euryale.AAC.1